MNKPLFAFALLLIAFSCVDNEEDIDPTLKGLVTFAEDPTYANDKISFAAGIQYGFAGRSVTIEYQILDGTQVVASGSANANINTDGGLNAFFETSTIQEAIDAATYSGKLLTVWLDPQNKVTAEQYTTQQNVDLWKKENVNIP